MDTRRAQRRPDRHAAGDVNLGFAASTEARGTDRPVVKNAETMNLLGPRQSSHGHRAATRDKKTSRRVQATFTNTNHEAERDLPRQTG